jgi:tape measure domain-containing protein
MARASVELIVEAAKAVNPLRKVEQQSKKVDQALKKSQKSARDVEAAFQRMGRKSIKSVRDLETNVSRLSKSMGGLRAVAAKVAIGFTGFKAVQAAIGREESIRRINRLGSAYGEVADLQNAATKAAETFGLSQTEANQQFSQIYARLRPVGVTLKDIESTFVGFNTVARLSGATSVEASNAFTQLAQALGSGALRGDEFNSISEQVPGILTAISQETGIAQGNLREFAAEGKITSDIVMRALKRIEKEGAEGLKDAMGGPAQAFKDFQNIAENALVALGEESIPQVVRLIGEMGKAIEALMPVIKAVGGFAARVLGGVADIIERIRDPGKLQREAQAHFDKGLGKRPIANLPANLKQTEAPFFATPPSPVVSGGINLGLGGAGGKAAKERVDMTQKLFDLNQQLRQQQEAGNEREVATLELMIRRQQIAEGNLLPIEKENELQEALYRFRSDIFELDKRIADQRKQDQADAAKALQDQIKAEQDAARKRLEADPMFQMKQQLEELLDVQNQAAAGATAIGNAFSNAFTSIINGTKSADQAIADMLSSVAEHFMDMAAQIIAKQLAMIAYGLIMKALGVGLNSGGGGGFEAAPLGEGFSTGATPSSFDAVGAGLFAEGGYVSGPTRAVIGEGGESEYVIPESKMRESMARYSRGARGSAVIPKAGGSGTSGEGGGTAVAAPIDVRYTVERINSVDYVTADQFQRGLQQAAAQGATQGEQRALTTLRQNTSQRKRIGL